MNSVAATPRPIHPLTNPFLQPQMFQSNFGCSGTDLSMCLGKQLPAGGNVHKDTHGGQCCCHAAKDIKRKRFRKNDDQTSIMED